MTTPRFNRSNLETFPTSPILTTPSPHHPPLPQAPPSPWPFPPPIRQSHLTPPTPSPSTHLTSRPTPNPTPLPLSPLPSVPPAAGLYPHLDPHHAPATHAHTR